MATKSSKDGPTSPAELTSETLGEYFRARVAEHSNTQAMSASQLADLAGVPRSTISMILSNKQDRLPSLLNCLKIAYALHVEVDDLLPKVVAANLTAEKLAASFIHPQKLSPMEMLQVVKSAQPWETAYLCPDTLPEFCKTPAFVAYENNMSLREAELYLSDLGETDFLTVPGVVLLKETVLNDLIDRRNAFANVSGIEALRMLDNLRSFAANCAGDAHVVVADATTHAIDTIFIINDRIAITYPFGSYFVSTDKDMIAYIRDRFEAYAHSLPSLEAWYSQKI